MRKTMAHIDYSGITKPFHRADIFPASGTMGNLADLKFLIVLPQEHRNVVVDILYLTLVKTLRILRYVLLIVEKKLPLHLERAAEIALLYKQTDHRRHSADNHIVAKQPSQHIHLQGSTTV